MVPEMCLRQIFNSIGVAILTDGQGSCEQCLVNFGPQQTATQWVFLFMSPFQTLIKQKLY